MTIKDLEPKLIWQCFDQLTQVPRPTHHLEKVREFLVNWATEHNIPVKTDEIGNVVMTKPATPGHENAPTVVLQGHQDMVAEKRADKEHDFINDPITTIVKDGWLHADGTTLGADNGLGCAAAMAVLLDDTLVHGPIEALFTVDEEQGMDGAQAMAPDFISGDVMLNLDSEEHGQLVIGCAGSCVTICRLPIEMTAAPEGYKYYKATVDRLTGGHSGLEIHLGRANANKMLARFLWNVNTRCGVVVNNIDGGGLPNAIPMTATAIFGVPADKADQLKTYAAEFNETVHKEYALTEKPDFIFEVEEAAAPADVIVAERAKALVGSIFGAPNGVQQMSAAAPGLAETSCNLASVHIEGAEAVVTIHSCSFVDSCRDEICQRLQAIFEVAGAKVSFGAPSSGWAPNPASKVLNVAKQSFEDLFGRSPRVEAIHAGLESSLFIEKRPNLDVVSFGPTLKDIHSPSERANIQSVADFWKFLTDILRRLA